MRGKKAPCEMCEDWWQEEQHEQSTQLYVEFYPDAYGLLCISAFGINEDTGETEEIKQSFDVKYCPFCGRKLEV